MQVHIFRPMCGRFDNLIARDAYRGLFKAQRLPKSNFPLRYNVAPTDPIPIVRIDPRDGEREVVMARWGLIPFWMKDKPNVPHINARAETVHKLPPFRESCKTALSHSGDGILRGAKARRWQATISLPAQGPRAFRIRGHMGVCEARRGRSSFYRAKYGSIFKHKKYKKRKIRAKF
jgi:hypothetical protein